MGEKLALLAALLLAACQTPSGDFCQLASPIRPTHADAAVISDTLVEQIVKHDERGQKLCGWEP